jgi:HSP20 family molecular chaperone IbpA
MYNFRFDDRDFQQFAQTMGARLNDIFEEVGKAAQNQGSNWQKRAEDRSNTQPQHGGKLRTDVAEDNKNIYVSVELPGVRKEDVSVTLNDENVLTVTGEKKRPGGQVETGEAADHAANHNTNEPKFTRVERRYGTFSRSIQLEVAIEQSQITATFADGVLTITLPKLVPEQPKEFRVNIA